MGKEKKIGFIGLGIMGRAMAMNLVRAGYDLSVYNRTRNRAVTSFQDMNCFVAGSPEELSRLCDIVIIMVSDAAAVREIMEKKDGVFAGITPGKTVVNMSTVYPEFTSELADKCERRHVNFLDCPVSGSKPLAETGKLVILASGPEPAVRDCEKMLRTMGKELVYAGKAPAGTSLKLSVNLVLAQMSTCIAEGAAFASSLNIDPDLVFRTLALNPAMKCGYFEMKRKNIISGTYPAAFPLKHMLKDVKAIRRCAETSGMRLPVTEGAFKLLSMAEAAGFGEDDVSAVHAPLAGIKKE